MSAALAALRSEYLRKHRERVVVRERSDAAATAAMQERKAYKEAEATAAARKQDVADMDAAMRELRSAYSKLGGNPDEFDRVIEANR